MTDNSVTSYGIGVVVSNIQGHPTVSHTGGMPRFHSSLTCVSNHEIAVAVIINAAPAPAGVEAHSIALEVAEAALGSL